jgi:hypothetical protein
VNKVLLASADPISFPGERHVRKLLIGRNTSDPLDLVFRQTQTAIDNQNLAVVYQITPPAECVLWR